MTPTSAPPTTGGVRLVRAGVLGGCALALAVVAHVAAGGAAPGAVPLALLGLATAAPVLVLTSVRLGRGVLLLALGGLEVALHAGLTLLAGSGTASVLAESHHHATVLATGTHAGHGPAMLLAHAVATALTAVVLAHGEELLWLALTTVAPVLAAAVAAAVAALRTLAPTPSARPGAPLGLRPRPWVRCARRRGPPLAA